MRTKPQNYWTKEKCHEEALKYEYKKDFKNFSGSAYSKSHINNWIDEICSHMKILGSKSKKCIYSYEFPDNHVYVGLTYNIENRDFRHFNNARNSAVKEYKEKCNLDPILRQLTEFLDVNLAIKKEEEFVQKYEQEGWIILNKVKTGSIGGNVIKWTK